MLIGLSPKTIMIQNKENMMEVIGEQQFHCSIHFLIKHNGQIRKINRNTDLHNLLFQLMMGHPANARGQLIGVETF